MRELDRGALTVTQRRGAFDEEMVLERDAQLLAGAGQAACTREHLHHLRSAEMDHGFSRLAVWPSAW